MVAAAARRRSEGLVPFDPLRHLGPVAELIALSFAGELGPAARHTLRQMRRMARWGSLGFLLWGVETGTSVAPGFVWLEGGRVVGNVSLRRTASPGGWMIGNVAVHPEWRGRGIGRALIEAAVETAAGRGGSWVGLEVREDNPVARSLYESMGFESVGTLLELTRPAGLPWSVKPRPPHTPPIRRARAAESTLLYQLAQEGLSRPHREVLEIRPSLYRAGWEAKLSAWLEGGREDWWVAIEEGRVMGAVGLYSYWSPRYHRIEVLARTDRLTGLGPRLAAFGLARLSHHRLWEIVTMLPGPMEALEPAFAAAGFQRLRRLVQMRLILGQRVVIR